MWPSSSSRHASALTVSTMEYDDMRSGCTLHTISSVQAVACKLPTCEFKIELGDVRPTPRGSSQSERATPNATAIAVDCVLQVLTSG